MDEEESALNESRSAGDTRAARCDATASQQNVEDAPNAGRPSSGSNPIGPDNPALHDENPDSVIPPPTDHGKVQPFKYPFSFSHKRTEEGGWARQVTIQDLPVAKTLAGVNMRLVSGGIRELHWHAAGEWSIMLYGSARITCFDQHGKPFIDDVKAGDLWFFPAGYPHSIQGLAPDGCEFLLIFADGAFSEYDTILLADYAAHTPRDVLAKNFGVSIESLSKIPTSELYIFNADLPTTSLQEARRQAAGTAGLSTQNFSFHMMEMSPTHKSSSGEVRIVDSSKFPVSNEIAAAYVIVHPGGMREIHWHQNADEWQYYIIGKARMTVFAAGSNARTMDFSKGDVGYVPKTFPHYVENTGTDDLIFVETFRSSLFQDFSLNNWLTHLPPQLVISHLHIDEATLNSIPKQEAAIVPL